VFESIEELRRRLDETPFCIGPADTMTGNDRPPPRRSSNITSGATIVILPMALPT